MTHEPHPAATHHLPMFFTAPGETDILFGIVAVTLVVAILAAGVFFFWMHSLPERLVHDKVQFDIVAVLALLSLFTRRFCRPRRPAPRQRARTPRLISPRQPSMPACPVGSSNSSSGSATSSIRSGARPEYSFHRELVNAR
jgi:uncharacterized membrane protein (UPF0136 family)